MKKVANFEKVDKEIFDAAAKDAAFPADYNDIILPRRATAGSAGYDFYAPADFTLKKGESVKIPTGVRAKIDEGYFLSVYPRSGLGFKYRNSTIPWA